MIKIQTNRDRERNIVRDKDTKTEKQINRGKDKEKVSM